MSDLKDLIIKKDNLTRDVDGTLVDGYALIGSYTVQPTKNGGTYILGSMDCIGQFQFKVWSGDLYNKLNTNSVSGKICYITGKVNDYNGMKSVILESCEPYEGTDLIVDDFLISRYNADSLFGELYTMLSLSCTTEGLEIFTEVMSPIQERFCQEYAASSHHDAVRSGLLAHTFKTVKLVQTFNQYNEILNVIDSDLLYISTALHDIGKIVEYNMGTVTDIGKQMSHLTLGVELITPYRDFIIERKGVEFYSNLISVIQQHHGEYGERPRTLIAYIIHLIDGMEAHLTDIDDAIRDAASNQVKINSYKLSFNKGE